MKNIKVFIAVFILTGVVLLSLAPSGGGSGGGQVAANGITNGQPSVILGTNLLFGVGGYTQGLFNIASSATTPGQINIGDWFGQKNSTLISVDDTTGIENIELFANKGIILFANITNSTGGYYGNGIGLTNIQARGVSTNGSSAGQFIASIGGRSVWTNVVNSLSANSLVISNSFTNAAAWTGQVNLPLLLTATNYFTNTYGGRGMLHIDYLTTNDTALGVSFFMATNLTSGVGRWKQSMITGATIELVPGEVTIPVSPGDIVLVTNISNAHVVEADYSQ